ncbi:hypothetical protein C8R44DRAFT_784871 [Mycena epipterygia]|nr:hypothetical protein C8R44DRAFT_784871 [Mycena epipterygia]
MHGIALGSLLLLQPVEGKGSRLESVDAQRNTLPDEMFCLEKMVWCANEEQPFSQKFVRPTVEEDSVSNVINVRNHFFPSVGGPHVAELSNVIRPSRYRNEMTGSDAHRTSTQACQVALVKRVEELGIMFAGRGSTL